jgi:hypothetical protein
MAMGIVILIVAPCTAFVPSFATSSLRPARHSCAQHFKQQSFVLSSREGQAPTSGLSNDGAGRAPPKPLAKYTMEPVGNNIRKADSAKCVFSLDADDLPFGTNSIETDVSSRCWVQGDVA